jgi:hypothetical protein
MNSVKNVYHASTEIVRNPVWNYRKQGSTNAKKDFGDDFYICENMDYPIKLYSANDEVIINEYLFDISGLNILTLKDDVHWLLSAAFHRSDFSKKTKWHALRDKYRQQLSRYDVIVGSITNDRFFSTLDAFIDGLITDEAAIGIIQMMTYPPQLVLKSDKACARLKFVSNSTVEKDVIDKYRKQVYEEKDNMDELVQQKRIQLMRKTNGKYMPEILDEFMKGNHYDAFGF